MIELDHAEVQVLGERGFFLQDGFLGPDAAGAACTAARALADAGGLRTAGVSRGTGYRRDPATRGDEAAWLLPADAPAELVLDRLVVFLADRIEHEVLLAAAPRWAVTAWYCGREDIPRA